MKRSYKQTTRSMTPWSVTELMDMVRWLNEDWSTEEVATKLGRSVSGVSTMITLLRVGSNATTAESYAHFIQTYHPGETVLAVTTRMRKSGPVLNPGKRGPRLHRSVETQPVQTVQAPTLPQTAAGIDEALSMLDQQFESLKAAVELFIDQVVEVKAREVEANVANKVKFLEEENARIKEEFLEAAKDSSLLGRLKEKFSSATPTEKM